MLYERIRTRVATDAGDGDGEEVGDGVVQDTTNTVKAIRTKLRKRTRYLARILAILQPLSGNFGRFTGPWTFLSFPAQRNGGIAQILSLFARHNRSDSQRTQGAEIFCSRNISVEPIVIFGRAQATEERLSIKHLPKFLPV